MDRHRQRWVRPLLALTLTAWDDVDKDGIRQDGEPVRRMELTLTGTTDYEGPLTRTVTSDYLGEYDFYDLPSGTYRIQVTSPVNMEPTSPHVGEWYLDSDLVGVDRPTSEPLRVHTAAMVINVDIGFVVKAGVARARAAVRVRGSSW